MALQARRRAAERRIKDFSVQVMLSGELPEALPPEVTGDVLEAMALDQILAHVEVEYRKAISDAERKLRNLRGPPSAG